MRGSRKTQTNERKRRKIPHCLSIIFPSMWKANSSVTPMHGNSSRKGSISNFIEQVKKGSNIAERKHSDAEERELIHAFSSLYLHRPDRRPTEHATWNGHFLVHHDPDDPVQCYYFGDLEGRSTGKVHCETYQFSRRLASYIHFNVLERSSVWHGLFQEDDEELALYFLPKDVKSQTNYQILLDLVDENLLLISPIHNVDAELMVFSSRLLHPNAKRAVLQYENGKEIATSKGIDFLCGIFVIGPKRVGVFLQ